MSPSPRPLPPRGELRGTAPIGPCIVDFISPEARLVVELDGGQHQASDAGRLRDAWLESQGFRVLRFWSNDILTNLPAVLEKIASLVSPSPQPSPAGAKNAGYLSSPRFHSSAFVAEGRERRS